MAPAVLAIMKFANGIRLAPAMSAASDRSTATKRATSTTPIAIALEQILENLDPRLGQPDVTAVAQQ